MKKSFAFQIAIVAAALAFANVACSRKGKSNNDDRVGAVGPADKPAPTIAEILNPVFKRLEPTFSAGENSISDRIQAASVGKSMVDTSANGAIGTPISTLKVSLVTGASDETLDFTGDQLSLTDLKNGKILNLTTKGKYDISKIGESLTVRAQCLDNCDRMAVLVVAFKKEGYKMDSKPQVAGIIFKQTPGKGYQIEHSLTPIKDLEKTVPVQSAEAELPLDFSTPI